MAARRRRGRGARACRRRRGTARRRCCAAGSERLAVLLAEAHAALQRVDAAPLVAAGNGGSAAPSRLAAHRRGVGRLLHHGLATHDAGAARLTVGGALLSLAATRSRRATHSSWLRCSKPGSRAKAEHHDLWHLAVFREEPLGARDAQRLVVQLCHERACAGPLGRARHQVCRCSRRRAVPPRDKAMTPDPWSATTAAGTMPLS